MNQQDTNQVTSESPSPMTAQSSPHRHKTRILHGLSQQIRGRSVRNTTKFHGNSALAKTMADYRASLIASLGGAENLSQQELSLVELCGRDWIILEQIDGFLLTTGSFSKKKRAAFPLLATRSQISDSLTRKLQALGLSRRAKPVSSLAALLSGSPNNAATGGIPNE